MAKYEFLKKLFGEEDDGSPKSMTYDELENAIKADGSIKLYNLSEGGYVSKEKLDAKIAELSGLKAQLEEASKEIQSYKDMDIEGIKASARDWEKKYKADLEKMEKKIEEQEYDYQVMELANGLKFSSASAKRAFLADIKKNRLSRKDGKVLGFDDYVNQYRESDPDAFVKEAPKEPEQPKPKFSEQKTKTPKTKLSLSELMSMANEGKDVSSFM